MLRYDVFNGDADGICALTQLRLAEPGDSVLVTGVKRDIELLQRVEAGAGDRVTVLDVSLDKNRAPLERLLASGAEVFYVDHHFAGEIPAAPGLTALINESPEVCTSLLVNGHLRGRFAEWAVVGAYGDNLHRSARAVADTLGLDERRCQALEALGTYINYNGYGAREEDLHFPPAELFRQLAGFASPFAYMAENAASFERLEQGYRGDMAQAAALAPEHATPAAAVFILPDAPWARRVSGVYSNDLANAHPERAHAVLTPLPGGGFVVSVRAPLANRSGADVFCRRYPTGGGRAAAAGINHLPVEALAAFCDAFAAFYAGVAR